MTASNNTSTTPEFISLDEAAAMFTGTRVTFIPGMPALYSEALKNICYAKGVPLIRALHPMMGVDKTTGQDRQARLFELTSQTSLPTMFHNDERPRNVWTEQLALAELIGSADSPKLIPDDFDNRVTMFGLCAIVLGEDGFVWKVIVNALRRKGLFQEKKFCGIKKHRSARTWGSFVLLGRKVQLSCLIVFAPCSGLLFLWR